jgi:hypothetical protein
MPTDAHDDDVRAIEALIARQFASLSWGPGASGDWAAFAADFFPGASLYPAARPVKPQTVDAFIARMQGLARTSLRSFREDVLGAEIRVFGNVAVAVAAGAMTENDAGVTRSVEMLLLVKDGRAWRIVAQAWDAESTSRPIPAPLLGDPSRDGSPRP